MGHKRALREVQAADVIGNDFGTHGLGVVLHADHQIGALDMRVTRPVFHLGRDGQLPAGLQALHKDGVQHGAGGIDGGGIACGAGADD